MGFIVRFLIAAALALAAGIWSAFAVLDGVAETNAVRNGAWIVNTAVGSKEAGPYTRAMAAQRGLLALDKSEALYFTARTDDAGDPLTGNCDYTVTGALPPALWSSFTVYGEDGFLVANEWNRWSYPLADLAGPEGTFSVAIGASPRADPWLPVAAGAPFSLTLRLYLPEAAVVEAPGAFGAPRIVKESCR